MDDESSDILGQRTKPALRGNKNSDWLGASLTVKLALGLAIVLALYVVVMRIWFRILVWKERSYKLYVPLLLIIYFSSHTSLLFFCYNLVQCDEDTVFQTMTIALSTWPTLP